MLEEKVFQDLLEAAPDGVVIVDSSGRMVFANMQAEHMFGYTQRELIGRPIEVLVPSRARTVHNLHRSGFLNEPRPRPMGAGLTLMARRKDGTEFPVEISLSPIESKAGRIVGAIVRDISDRRRAEDTLRAQAELLDFAHDAIIVHDMQRRIEFWNAGAERTYGWTSEEAIGHTIDELLHTDSSAIDRSVTEIMANSLWEGEHRHVTQDERTIVVASRQTLRRGLDGSAVSTLEVNRDITERKLLEAERATIALETERQLERDRIAMDLHDGVIQSIYAVGLNLETIAEDVANNEEASTRIDHSIERLQSVIADIRGYIFQLRRPDLTGDVVAAIESLTGNVEEAGTMAVETNLDADIRLITDDRAIALYHITQEALANALRHSRASIIRVTAQHNNGYVVLTIDDDGIGFDASLAAGGQHNGVRNMAARAKAVGGEFAVDSKPGSGSHITLRLPS